MTDASPEEVIARFEELSVLEEDFEDAECEIIRKSDAINAPLYKRRAQVIAKVPHFWALVFEQAPPDVDNFIQPSDSKIFAECLQTFEVSRFEINDPKGSPRSFSVKFGFSENEYFTDSTIEKKFWYRFSSDGWEGLVSEPVKINWKEGKDATDGLVDAAYNLHQAKLKKGTSKETESSLPEYKFLVDKVDESDQASISFFAWFGFVSSYRWVSAEESQQATKKKAERIERQRNGQGIMDDLVDEPEIDFQESEVFLQGDELATLIADDMWPSAIKYYKHAHEAEDDDDDLSDIQVDDRDHGNDSDEEDEIDIRALVGKSRNGSSDSPPPKKQRKS